MRRTALAGCVLLGLSILAGSAAAQTPARWSLTPDLRIGSADRRDYALTDVADLAVDGAGAIHVAQPREMVIRVYGRDGRYLRSIGRSGAGPGEFQMLERLGWRGDTLYAVDPVLNRLTLFRPGGTVARTVSASVERVAPHLGPASPVGLFSDGTVLGRPPHPRALIERGAPDRVPLVRLDPDLAVLGNVAWLNALSSADLRIRFEPNGTFYVTSPIAHETLWDVAPDGSALVTVERIPAADEAQATFSVAKVMPDGAPGYLRRYRYRPSPISGFHRDSLVARIQEFVREGARGRFNAEPGVREAFRFPTFERPVTALVAGRDGTVWLRREALGRARVTWNVLDAEGTVIALVNAPAGLVIHQASRQAVWGVVKDEDDVPYVVRYRVGVQAP